MPLHDLVIKTFAYYLLESNTTLAHLQRINKRFYSLRDIFIQHMCLTSAKVCYILNNHPKPYGWNKVHCLNFNYSPINNPILSTCCNIDTIQLNGCGLVSERSLCTLTKLHGLILIDCQQIHDLSPLINLRRLSIDLQHMPFFRINSIFKLTNLTHLDIDSIASFDCQKIPELTFLRIISINRCKNILSLPSLGWLQVSRKLIFLDTFLLSL